MSDRVQRLEERIGQLSVQRAAAVRREARENRRLANRRKYLVGACALANAGGDVSQLWPPLLAALDAWATRPRDRAALGLPPVDRRSDP